MEEEDIIESESFQNRQEEGGDPTCKEKGLSLDTCETGGKKKEVKVKVKEIWKGANLKEVPFDGVSLP